MKRFAILGLLAAALASPALGSGRSAPKGHIVFGMNRYCLVGSEPKRVADCGKGEIAVVNADGSALRVLTHNAVTEVDPVWSPDGTRIAFLRPQAHTSDRIWLMNANGTHQRALTDGAKAPRIFGAEDLPVLSWSPDGRQIVFCAVPSKETLPQLFLLDVRTRGLTRLTHVSTGAANPVWSPNGRWIAYRSSESRDPLYVLSPSTHKVHALKAKNGHEVDGLGLAWSPDSRSLAFNSHGHIVAFDTVTKVSKTLSQHGVSPSWSPDGSWIVFDDATSLKEVRANGIGVRSILHINAHKRRNFEPNWGR